MAGGLTARRRRLALAEVDSTNTVALEAARAGDPGSLWVTAEQQTNGRGRRGRAWVSEPGNLYLSWLLVDPAPIEHLSNLPLVASLGVRNGLAHLRRDDHPAVSVKWPNDVLVSGKKCVGILLESERLANGRMAVAIGCGVNVAHQPGDAPYRVTNLHAEGVDASLETIFDAVADGLMGALTLFARGTGFGAIRREWLAHAVGLGAPCRINLAEGSLEGRFEALDERGRLVLAQNNGGCIAVSAGDLFFLDRDERVPRSGRPADLGRPNFEMND